MFKRTHGYVATAVALGLSVGSASGMVTSTFDTDLEGWTAAGFNIDDSFGALLSGNVLTLVNNAADIVHDAGGDSDPAFTGNPGGFARFTDAITDPSSFALAPAEYTGDLTGFLGGTFSYQHRLFNEGADATSVGPYVIVFISGDPNDLAAYAAILPGPSLGDADTDWVTVSTVIDETNLTPISQVDLGLFSADFAGDTVESLSGGLLATAATLDAVLSDVTEVLVSFELVDNNSTQVSESAGIDNVKLEEVPEPASLALIGLGSTLLLRRRP